LSNQGPNPSFVLQAKDKVVFEDRPVPKIVNPTDVIVQVQATGICGSDVHYYVHGSIGKFVVKDPMVLGHESAGTVVEIGSAVTNHKVGDKVCMEPGIPCRHCEDCKGGRYNLCPDMAFAATPPYDGTLAKYYRLPQDFCYNLGKLSVEEGAMMEPLSVAVHAVKLAGVTPGSSIAVFGAGPVGVLIAAVARHGYNARTVTVIDINEERLKFAKNYAATHTFVSKMGPTAQETAQQIIAESGVEANRGFDFSIDATGAQPCIQTAMHLIRPGGSYVQTGMGKDEITFPIAAMCIGEFTVKGCFRYGKGDYQQALQFVQSGKIDVKKLITGTVKFEDALTAFESVKAGKGLKTVILGPQ
jgi:D-xylulose reductase